MIFLGSVTDAQLTACIRICKENRIILFFKNNFLLPFNWHVVSFAKYLQ